MSIRRFKFHVIVPVIYCSSETLKLRGILGWTSWITQETEMLWRLYWDQMVEDALIYMSGH